jgi:hypothetical protein
MSVDNVLDWTRRSYFNNSLYNQYTNYRFLEVERENALIYETTKAYYTLYLLVVFVGFLVLNRLFKCLQRFRVSQILRVYSFWLHYVFIVVLSDSTKLSFLSLNYLQMLFSFSINTKILHAVSILLIGVLIIVLLSLFFMSSYLYGNLCRYFLVQCLQDQVRDWVQFSEVFSEAACGGRAACAVFRKWQSTAPEPELFVNCINSPDDRL